ncbi:MAG: peptidase M64 [Stygiobacter sp. RIFOXYC12_FULL_38_8]|nr:MAG: peptidase M64 [Stygiobacter sp. GWC2_38_9]OGU84464.1 MAG: peptidase M64 [Stygiobacter sp. RIFOXYA12_FULL_38_9]OGV07630.1 MAG: peptidase M64 [Stygiobacter sp. RIFOXYB2_FULL_37_11]OGV10792.1 MAG: peptidase M64 [Stygiobacter sp. RIFOXYA2_FULL_38_8]OGV12633.1 MAG: peptidase M64 [Stygiobacter sp. RIFOXYC2_FULL_38_25]OGV26891.1 MAG: peptidase M64 [Stygiobacter sp. RIFOXYC12_FULL_38_8]RJQ62439.1 MAG: peptidase M64 [Stygiobacter sp.]
MKFTRMLMFSLMILTANFLAQSVSFNDYFSDQTMRVDYFHIGDATTEVVTVDHIYQYGIWAGSTKNLLDNFNNGAYYYKIYDAASGKLIFSRGFDSYFKEYQTSDEASKGIKRTYHESAIIPFPKNKIKLVLEKRDKQNKLNEVFSTEIDPSDLYIIKDNVKDKAAKVYKSHFSGNPHAKVDVVILADGYSAKDQKKFEKDLKRYTNLLINQEPFKKSKDRFNIYGVFKVSEDSGIDEPGANIYKNTTLSTTFYSLGSERYVLTEDNKSMRDLAAYVPYDAIYIMCNSPRYGGGGIYNFYCTFVSDNQFSPYIFLHEFGHSFGGLADEYYTSDVAYNEFYTAGLEPVEPNITRVLDPKNVKWKESLSEGIAVPTLWEKENYDKMDLTWQKERRELNKKIAELKRNRVLQKEVDAVQNEYNMKDKLHSDEVDQYLMKSKFWNKVGVFEGAGYSSNGMYRSMLDCLMFSKGTKPFCKVCEEHVAKVINQFAE